MAELTREERTDQRSNIKFCQLLGKNCTETYQMLQQAYQDKCLPKSTVFRWFSLFEAGRKDSKDLPRPGRPISVHTKEMVDKVREMVATDRRLSVRMIAETLSVGKDTIHQILTQDLNKRKKCSRIVPKILSLEEKANRKACCEDELALYRQDETFIERIITGDETWVFGYEPETKRQSLEWRSPGSPVKKIAKMSKSKIKTMLITFFDAKGLIHHEFVPEGQTVTQYFYRDVLGRLFEKMRKKRSDLWKSKEFLLLHDNARPHVALSVNQFLSKKGVTVMPHPPLFA